jgi:hypothetical protein
MGEYDDVNETQKAPGEFSGISLKIAAKAYLAVHPATTQ